MNSSGILNYMSEKSHNSLYKNGKVFTKRDINGSDAGSKGIDLYKKNIKILDARETSQKNKISIDKQGFEILHSNINNLDLDFFNNKEVLDKYYSYCANFIKDRTGAKDVYAFDHNIDDERLLELSFETHSEFIRMGLKPFHISKELSEGLWCHKPASYSCCSW